MFYYLYVFLIRVRFRERKVLENKALADDDKIEVLEMQLKEAQLISEEMDKKFDAVSRTLVVVEGNLERAEERAESGETWVYYILPLCNYIMTATQRQKLLSLHWSMNYILKLQDLQDGFFDTLFIFSFQKQPLKMKSGFTCQRCCAFPSSA